MERQKLKKRPSKQLENLMLASMTKGCTVTDPSMSSMCANSNEGAGTDASPQSTDAIVFDLLRQVREQYYHPLSDALDTKAEFVVPSIESYNAARPLNLAIGR